MSPIPWEKVYRSMVGMCATHIEWLRPYWSTAETAYWNPSIGRTTTTRVNTPHWKSAQTISNRFIKRSEHKIYSNDPQNFQIRECRGADGVQFNAGRFFEFVAKNWNSQHWYNSPLWLKSKIKPIKQGLRWPLVFIKAYILVFSYYEGLHASIQLTFATEKLCRFFL